MTRSDQASSLPGASGDGGSSTTNPFRFTPTSADSEVGVTSDGVTHDDPEQGAPDDEPGDDTNATFETVNTNQSRADDTDPTSYKPDTERDDGSGDSGGLLNEVGAVLDPTRRASTQTEQAIGVAGKAAYMLTSPAAAGAMAGSTGDPTGTSDELVGRQFDRRPGGGYGDVGIEEAGDAAPDLPEPPGVMRAEIPPLRGDTRSAGQSA